MSSDLFRQYINIINENSQPEEKGTGHPAFQRAYHSGEGPQPPEPMEIIDDPEEIASMIHQAYNMPDSSDPEENAQNADIRKMVKAALLELEPREERIIRMRFGIGVPEMTLDAISDKFGISGNRIRQIEAKAIRKMKHPSRILRKSEKKRLPPAPTYAAYDKDSEKYDRDWQRWHRTYNTRPDNLE
jgi:RNA polymerase sigma factor (sigma-70 family)